MSVKDALAKANTVLIDGLSGRALLGMSPSCPGLHRYTRGVDMRERKASALAWLLVVAHARRAGSVLFVGVNH